MALCKVCRTIPFDSLTSVLEGITFSSKVADDSDMTKFIWGKLAEDKLGSNEYPIGFAWHESFDALARSARVGCPLCALVQVGVQNWLDKFHNAEKNYPGWAQFYKDSEAIPNGQTLWLSKRLDKRQGTGFVVMVRTVSKRSWKGAYFLTGISFGVPADSALVSSFPSRPIERDSGSQKSLDIAAALVRSCVDEHEGCRHEETALPTRVLDVGFNGITIKLIEPPGNLRARYISLSHCWGTLEMFTTTKESYQERTSGIVLTQLPKTFLDAVIIARYLGIRYLWIDSLCIVQGDKDDWVRESARMTDVYSNAYLVIAADHSKDGNGGCFHQRPTRPGAKIPLPGVGEIYAQVLKPSEEWSATDFNDEPLSKRGWTLQERVLARRILHYNSSQIYFECNKGVASESGCTFDHRYSCKLSDLSNAPANTVKDSARTMWNDLLSSYGQRKLTKATDKLPAISGLAKLFKSQFNAEYVAGLWSNNFIEGLAWQGIGERKPNSAIEYTGPSWSWASFGGIAATGLNGKWTDVAKILNWKVELRNEENIFGEVNDAWIRVHAPIAELKPSEVELTDHEIRLKKAGKTPLPRLGTRFSEKKEGTFTTLDYDAVNESGEWKRWGLQVMVLCGRKELSYGMVVTGAGTGQDGKMRRVGWMHLEPQEADKLVKAKETWRTVILV